MLRQVYKQKGYQIDMTQYTYQERFKTEKGVFDEFTKRNLFELQSRNIIDEEVELSPYKIGKESNVFLTTKQGQKVIVKIYRLQNADFKRMYNYIKKDPRYSGLKNHRRQIIFAWTQREFKNLLRAQKAGILAPKPLALRENIIVEEMIGLSQPALALKDAPPQQPEDFFNKVIDNVKKLYQAGLVHGDLSSFNILNHADTPYLIDFSQTTLTRTPNSEELLERDLKNLFTYFRKFNFSIDLEQTLKKIRQKSI